MKEQEITFTHEGQIFSCKKVFTKKGLLTYILLSLISFAASITVFILSSKIIGALLCFCSFTITIFGKDMCFDYEEIKIIKNEQDDE